MLAILIFGISAGAILGSRFTIFVFVPVIIFASGAAVIGGIVSSYDARVIAFAELTVLASLQFGYIAGGILAEYFGEQTKSRRIPWRPPEHY